MNDLSPIETQKFPRRDDPAGIHAMAIIGALMRAGPKISAEVITSVLEDMTICEPEIAGNYLDSLREAAEFWADTASPAAVETYVAIGLRAIAQRRAFGVKARKRLMVEIWNSFTPEDRAAFLAMAKRSEDG
jgi:hypothetical protein